MPAPLVKNSKNSPQWSYLSSSKIEPSIYKIIFQYPSPSNQLPNQINLFLIGTAHVSTQSAQLVEEKIKDIQPAILFLELDKERRKAFQPNRWENLNLLQIIRSGKTFFFIAQLLLAISQKKIAQKIKSSPGQEFKCALDTAKSLNIQVNLIDRPIDITLKRFWRKLTLLKKLFLLSSFLKKNQQDLDSQSIENLKNETALANLINQLANEFPIAKEIFIDERDTYMYQKIIAAFPTNTQQPINMIAVVGAGHLPGLLAAAQNKNPFIQKSPKGSSCFALYETIPPKPLLWKIFPWILSASLLALFTSGFLIGGTQAFQKAIIAWIVVNGSLSAFGCLLAAAHPITILVGFIAAPITSLNPLIGAGLITSLSQLLLSPPRILDFKNVEAHFASFPYWWKNRITKVLLVFLFSSVGSAAGTWIALPYLTNMFL